MKRTNFFAPATSFPVLKPQAFVLMGPDRSKPAIFEGTVEEVRDWVLEKTRPNYHHNFTIYMEENATYMSIPQFLEITKSMGSKIGHINNSIAFRELSEKNPAGEKSETVDHPSHYNTGNIEVIDAIEDWKLGFSLGNAVKYIARAEHKGNNVEDLEKAVWYINREIQRLKGAVQEEESTQKHRKVGSFNDFHGFDLDKGIVFTALQENSMLSTVKEAKHWKKHGVSFELPSPRNPGWYCWIDASVPYGEIWEMTR